MMEWDGQEGKQEKNNYGITGGSHWISPDTKNNYTFGNSVVRVLQPNVSRYLKR